MGAFVRHLVTKTAPLLAAMQFLTRIPVPVTLDFKPDLLRRSTVYYPLVGLVLGVLHGLAAWLLGTYVPQLPAAVLLLVWTVWLTGALHLDGWMDTADGLMSHRSRERMLDIMRDSRVGAMGVMAAVLLLLLKTALLVTLLGLPPRWWIVLLVIPVCTRWMMVVAIAHWPYARTEAEGLGGMFAGVTRREAGWACCWTVVLVILVCLLLPLPWWQAAVAGIGMVALAWLVGYPFARSIARKLGGLTGDTYGAIHEWVECGLLLAVAIAVPYWIGTA